MTQRDLTPYLFNLIPDDAAQADALRFAATLRPGGPATRLEDVLMALSSFVSEHIGTAHQPNAHSAALESLRAAASGLYALLAQSPDQQGWSVLAAARMWMSRRAHAASLTLPYDVLSTFVPLYRAEDLPSWLDRAALAGARVEAGAYAGWAIALMLLETIPHLEDGHAEGHIDSLLKGLRGHVARQG